MKKNKFIDNKNYFIVFTIIYIITMLFFLYPKTALAVESNEDGYYDVDDIKISSDENYIYAEYDYSILFDRCVDASEWGIEIFACKNEIISSSTAVKIPSSIDGNKVISISSIENIPAGAIDSDVLSGYSSFKNAYALEFPDSLISIGDNAFSNENLPADLKIPEATKIIGKQAFKNSKADSSASLTIPNSVLYIGEEAFEYADVNLESNLTIPTNVCIIESKAFAFAKDVNEIVMRCDELEKIGSFAFYTSSDACKNPKIYLTLDNWPEIYENAFGFSSSDGSKMVLVCESTNTDLTIEVNNEQYGCIGDNVELIGSDVDEEQKSQEEKEKKRETLAVDSSTISGEDRYETACKIAIEAYPNGCTQAVIASGENYPDALSAAMMAAAHDCPILLTPQNELNDLTLEALRTLGVSEQIMLIGGEAAISEYVFSQLEETFTSAYICRLAGDTRYSTSGYMLSYAEYEYYIDERVKHRGLNYVDPTTVIIASGENYPDALSGSALSATLHCPILLCNKEYGIDSAFYTKYIDYGSDEMTAAKHTCFQYCKRVVIIGGDSVIPSFIETQISEATDGRATIERWAGENRYETNRIVCDKQTADSTEHIGKEYQSSEGDFMDYSTVVAATGSNYPDALTGSILAARKGGVISLISEENYILNPSDNETLIDDITFLGGESAISSNLKEQVIKNLNS